jgi:enterochelin esterase family protein
MRPIIVVVVLIWLPAAVSAAAVDNGYKLGPDSEEQPGVPHGKVIGPTTLPSNVYPNTTRNYWVYVPAQYEPSKPACLMIFQDGHAFVNVKGEYRIPNVFDNLIYRQVDRPSQTLPSHHCHHI